MFGQLFTVVSVFGLVGAGLAGAGEVRSAQAMPMAAGLAQDSGAGGGRCSVSVLRSGAAGTAAVTRQVLGDGSCQCTVTTGAADANGAAESLVGAIVSSGQCEPTATAAEQAAQQPGQGAGEVASAAGGGGGFAVPALLGALGAAGLAVGAGGAGSDSNG